MDAPAARRPLDAAQQPRRASDAARKRPGPAEIYAMSVIAVAVVFVAVLVAAGRFDGFRHVSPRMLLFMALAVAGELYMLRIPARTGDLLLTASSLFAYATALLFGPGPAMAALVLGTLIKDGVRDRRPIIKTAFNAADHGLTVGLAALVYEVLGGHLGARVVEHPLAAMAGAATYLCVNYLLTGTVIALATGARVVRHLATGLGSWLPVEGVMLASAPVVALVGQSGLLLLPLVVLPLLGVDYSARIAMRSEYASLHDALTGLPNRVLFRRRVEEALGRASRSGGEVVLMVLDLDRFKEVNDTLGHGRGDELLRHIADRLRNAVREADVVARLGGDEFGIVMVQPHSGQAEALDLARRIEDALDAPFALADLWVEGNASIGIACAPEHAEDAETLIQRADVAMYQAKQGGGGHRVYDPEADPNLPGKLRLLQDLRPAIEAGQLLLHYQPKVRVGDGALQGVEALVRWQHPTRGLLFPADFIELAERSNVVRALTLRVVRDAVRQAAQWLAQGSELSVAVNLSPRVLLDVALPADIALILEEEALPPRLLEVEITESCLIADPERTADILERLSETGVRISIDDFGTGYSSLSLLKRLPVDAIKIDRSFVGDVAHDANDMAIVESTIQLAASLGLVSVAEGVETPEAWACLEAFGCDEAQGYYVSRPLPAADIEAWLSARARRATGT